MFHSQLEVQPQKSAAHKVMTYGHSSEIVPKSIFTFRSELLLQENKIECGAVV